MLPTVHVSKESSQNFSVANLANELQINILKKIPIDNLFDYLYDLDPKKWDREGLEILLDKHSSQANVYLEKILSESLKCFNTPPYRLSFIESDRDIIFWHEKLLQKIEKIDTPFSLKLRSYLFIRKITLLPMNTDAMISHLKMSAALYDPKFLELLSIFLYEFSSSDIDFLSNKLSISIRTSPKISFVQKSIEAFGILSERIDSEEAQKRFFNQLVWVLNNKKLNTCSFIALKAFLKLFPNCRDELREDILSQLIISLNGKTREAAVQALTDIFHYANDAQKMKIIDAFYIRIRPPSDALGSKAYIIKSLSNIFHEMDSNKLKKVESSSGVINDLSFIYPFFSCAEDSDLETRIESIKALGKLFFKTSTAEQTNILESLLTCLRHHSFYVRRSASETIARVISPHLDKPTLGLLVNILILRLNHHYHAQRQSAAKTLSMLLYTVESADQKRIIDTTLPLLDNFDDGVRLFSAKLLRKIFVDLEDSVKAKTVETFIDILANTGNVKETFKSAIKALGKIFLFSNNILQTKIIDSILNFIDDFFRPSIQIQAILQFKIFFKLESEVLRTKIINQLVLLLRKESTLRATALEVICDIFPKIEPTHQKTILTAMIDALERFSCIYTIQYLGKLFFQVKDQEKEEIFSAIFPYLNHHNKHTSEMASQFLMSVMPTLSLHKLQTLRLLLTPTDLKSFGILFCLRSCEAHLLYEKHIENIKTLDIKQPELHEIVPREEEIQEPPQKKLKMSGQ